ncbi:MAG: HEAT repeat domain-containing protein [Acidobacteriota bacterium]|nr:MAG: HEAT repeat domain-containing protein [Acidobacteriota bacterium]
MMKQLQVCALTLLAAIAVSVSGCSYCGAPGREAAAPEGEFSIAELKAALRGERWEDRLAAVGQMKTRDDIPSGERIEILAEALAHEVTIQDPLRAEGSYLSATDIVRVHLTRDLGELGRDARETLRESLDQASGEARDRLILALGHAGDQSVSAEILKLLEGSENVAIRMEAARVLGLLDYREAIEALERALEDPAVVSAQGHLRSYTIYPVREQAAGALLRLGVQVGRNDQGELEIEGRNE